MLTDMDESQLRLAIAEPAARNGVIFEKGLINQIVADFYEQAGSLPLLQYTLDLLWQKNHIQERVLNIKIYQEIGGVTGALEKQADKIYGQFNEQQRKAAEEIFLELISLEGEKAVSRRADKSSFEQEEMQREVLYQKEEIIVLRSRLYADAKQWDDLQKQDAVKASSELWGGSKLKRIVNLIKEKSLSNLDDVAVKFIKASYHYQKQREKIEAERKRREVDTELSLANSLSGYSLHLFNEEGKELDAIVEAIKAGKILQKHNASNTKVIDALQKILVEGRESNRLVGHNGSVNSVSFSPDGKTLATGSEDKTIKLWNVETGQEIGTLRGHNGIVWSVSFSPDGKTLATGSEDKTIKLWDVETGQEIRTLRGHNGIVLSVSFSPDGKTLATGSKDKTIKLWDVETGQEIRTLSGHKWSVNSVSFSRDGKKLATGSGILISVRDNTIKLWNVETGEEIRTLKGHDKWVNSVNFSPDGKTLVSGSADNTIKLWNGSTGQEIRTLKGHGGSVESVNFSPDGKTLVSGSVDKTIKLWNGSTGQEIRTLKGHDYPVRSVNFSPDGKTLVSGSVDKTIKLWNVETGQEIRTLKGHDSAVTSVNFSPDGKTLVSGSEDNTIKLWNGDNGWGLDALMGRSCDWVRVYLHNPNSGVREEDRHLCDGIGGKSSVSGF